MSQQTLESQSCSVKVGECEITFETGKIARQANGSVVVKCGDTVIFSSACASKKPSENIDFLPLTVNYQEKFSSAGKSLGGFIKREGRPSEKETLNSRLTDRCLRPLFEIVAQDSRVSSRDSEQIEGLGSNK